MQIDIPPSPYKVEIASVLHHLHNVRLEEMAIHTPYSAQKEEIRKRAVIAKLLKEGEKESLSGIKVASITESQGKIRLHSSMRF